MQAEKSICLSGGAKGADLAFGQIATLNDHSVIHFTFPTGRHKIPSGLECVLSPDMLQAADPYIERANRTLRRKWPSQNPHVSSLIRRNYYQIRDSESLYAISEIDLWGQVKGGTAWAVQMMIDKNPLAPIWVFDQTIDQWYRWSEGWEPRDDPERPTGIYTGIGSRELSPSGYQAIQSLYR